MGDDDEEVVDNTAKANRADMNKLGGGGGDDDGGVDSDAAKKRALEMANDDLKKEKEAEAAKAEGAHGGQDIAGGRRDDRGRD